METFPNEPLTPPVWNNENFDQLLIWAYGNDASDISLLPDSKVKIRIHGKWREGSVNSVPNGYIENYLVNVSGNAAILTHMSRGQDLDISHEVEIGRGQRIRYRVNATSCKTTGGKGINIIFRSIPSTPPTTKDLQLEQDLLDYIFHPSGLVLIAGTMGSGKSTLLGAVLRTIREDQPHRSIATYEEPIEFDLTGIPNATGPITQTEIPTHLDKFDMAPRNATRRAADVILIGESRDLGTFRGMCEAAEIGTAVYTTVHTQSVAETIRRIATGLPLQERPQILTTLIGSLRLLVYQTLVPKVGGGRVAVREWLPIRKELRRKLMQADLSEYDSIFEKEICENGMPIMRYAKSLFEARKIDEDTLLAIEKKHAT